MRPSEQRALPEKNNTTALTLPASVTTEKNATGVTLPVIGSPSPEQLRDDPTSVATSGNKNTTAVIQQLQDDDPVSVATKRATSSYRNSTELEQYMADYQMRCSNVSRLFSIGTSVQGRRASCPGSACRAAGPAAAGQRRCPTCTARPDLSWLYWKAGLCTCWRYPTTRGSSSPSQT